MAGTKN